MFRKKCKHEYELIGDYYREVLTEFIDCFDSIDTFRKFKCKKCGELYDQLLTTEKFVPQLYKGRENRKDEYISKIVGMGFKQEVELLKERDENEQ